MHALPIVDVGPFDAPYPPDAAAGRSIDLACRTAGFFYLTGHGVPAATARRLETAARQFFALPAEVKMALQMERQGAAWRGYFPLGAELTSGVPDGKEGLYFGQEHPPSHPHVRAGTPLHGSNVFPESVPTLRPAVERHMELWTRVGQRVLTALALGLGRPPELFSSHLTRDPFVLFRIFHYPAAPAGPTSGVGEHTDYGLLTLLLQDDVGGLEVRTDAGWIAAPPIAGTVVCNVGDMLERLTGGRYRSTPHRVACHPRRDRLSFPLFLDPGFDTRVEPLAPPVDARAATTSRWDAIDPNAFGGTYGEYLLRKVGRVFPHLRGSLPARSAPSHTPDRASS